MEVGLVRSINIDQEMQQAYLDYAMSVIVARALPDARDGLKPVHRRILYAMYDMGMRPESPYKKSARIVGEVLGKYHPHGDMAVYDAMARMAQPFSLRCLLVDGQGNFGSVDGDPPAAMRYTEARLAPPSMNMLADIQKNTVDFSENFDGSLTEPDVLPAALPNLLVNGATGIAVGMSTSIPPHNLGEVVDALIYMLQNWDSLDDIPIENLMRFIQGPDFPTGGVLVLNPEEDGLASAYGTGRGRVTVQARVHVEEMSRGRNRIIVTELPYMTNKATLIERIAELVRDGRLDGVADLRDESDRQGLRVVIELTKTAEPDAVLKELFKSTGMKSTFGIIMLALVDGEPRMLSLKQALRVYLDHRLVVIKRRSEYDLEKARQRAHLLEGLRIALKFLDEVIALIRKSPDADTARTRLMKQFKLSQIQAQAILDMPLRRLAALERKKIEDEYKEVQALIKELTALLRSPVKMRQVVADDLQAVKEAFADRRRTQIVSRDQKAQGSAMYSFSDMTPERDIWISVTPEGLISRSLEDTPPAISGREAPYWALRMNTRDTLFLVSEAGDAVGVPAHSLPETANTAEGAPFYKVSAMDERDQLAGLFSLPPKEDRPDELYVITTTRQGMVKKTGATELPGPTAKTFSLTKVNESDVLLAVRLSNGADEVLLATADGMAIRFSEDSVRPMGLGSAGVGGIKLQGRDEVIGMELVPSTGELLFVTSDGKAKRVGVDQFPVQGRYGQGVVAWKLPRTSQLAGVAAAGPEKRASLRMTLYMDKLAPKALHLNDVPLQTRAALGKPVLDVKTSDKIVALVIARDLGRSKQVAVKAAPEPRKARASKPDLVGSSSEELTAKQSSTGKSKQTTKTSAEKSVPAEKPASAGPKSAVTKKTVSTPKSTRRPEASIKAAAASKAAADGKTPATVKPTPAKKPTAAKKAAAESKPSAAVKSDPARKPPAVKKTEKEVKPAATSKAPTGQKAAPAKKPATSTKAEPKAKPAGASKPAAKKSGPAGAPLEKPVTSKKTPKKKTGD